MKNLLRHELFKLKKSKVIYIVLAIAVIVSYVWAEIVVAFAAEDYAATGSESLRIVANMAQFMFIMLSVIISSIVVADYEKGIKRNIVMSGHSRTKIYICKYIISFFAAILLFTTAVIVCLVVTLRYNGWGSISFCHFILMYLQMLLQYAAMVAIIFFISDVTRGSAAAIGANICLILFLFFMTNLVFTSVGADGETITSTSKFLDFVGDMYPGVLSQRVTMPDLSVLKIVQYICTAIVTFTAVFIGGAYIFNKRDLK